MRQKSIYNHSYKYIIEKLKDERKKHKLNQQELGEKIGKPQKFISDLESYRTEISIDVLYAVTKALDISFIKLLMKYEQLIENEIKQPQ